MFVLLHCNRILVNFEAYKRTGPDGKQIIAQEITTALSYVRDYCTYFLQEENKKIISNVHGDVGLGYLEVLEKFLQAVDDIQKQIAAYGFLNTILYAGTANELKALIRFTQKIGITI